MTKNKNLNKAKRNKNDEFYTKIEDIEKEIKHYKKHFRNKTVYLNADDPEKSAFFKFFSLNFKDYGLKKLISTGYKIKNYKNFSEKNSGTSYVTFYEGERVKTIALKGNGDFRGEEAIELLKESDIVVTNPPFSLFREYVEQLIEYDKQFLIIGNKNAISYKKIFPLIKDNKLWLGITKPAIFLTPDEDGNLVETKSVAGLTRWFTNLEHYKPNEKIMLYNTYYGNENKYPKYDNFDVINVDRVSEIPNDYYDLMGVPITFLDKFNPEQFEIIGMGRYMINGKALYIRIIIKRKID